MSQLENIKQQMNYALNFAMKTLDKAIMRIPDDKLDFKPIDTLNSISDIASHVYMCSLVYTAGTLKGEFTDDDYSIIPFDFKNIKSAAEIVEYGKIKGISTPINYSIVSLIKGAELPEYTEA